MAGNMPCGNVWIAILNRLDHRGQLLILNVLVRRIVVALEFDSNRIIVTGPATTKLRLAGVPGSPLEGHELHDLAIAANEQVRRHAQPANLTEIGMHIAIKLIGKQVAHERTAELPGWQADAVNDDEFGVNTRRPIILIRRRALRCRTDQPGTGAHGKTG